LAFHHSILERTETKSFGDRSFKGWPPLLLQCHMSCYIAKWAVAGIVAGNLLPVLLPHSLHELAGNLLLHCQMSCGWDCSFPPPPAGVARLLSLLEAGVFAVHSLCVCHSLLANRQSPPPPGLLWLEAGWNLPAPSCCLGWKLCKSPPLPALAGSWVNESICPSECLLWLEAGVFPPFLLLAHNLIGIQQFLIVYDSTVT
jgi:hypothetical protein